MRTQRLLLPLPLLLFFFLSAAPLPGHATARRSTAVFGGYRPIEDVNDPQIVGIGRFAVSEHNRKTGERLVFVRVASGEQQVVAGMKYRLLVEAKDGGATNVYQALVYESASATAPELTSFELEAAERRPAIVGGYQPISNLSDPHVRELGQFAVSEHNRKAGDRLVFVEVVGGQEQVVAGMNYKLVIVAEYGSVKRKYEAVVYERDWENVRELTSFLLIP